METSNQRADFVDLLIFIERRVRILTYPLYGDIQDPATSVTGTRLLNRYNSQPSNRGQWSDNFIGAERELEKSLTGLNHKDTMGGQPGEKGPQLGAVATDFG